MLTFSGCIFENYDNWRTISFGGYGKIKIPKEWSMYHDGEFYYILDENDEPMLVQTSSMPHISGDNEDVPVGPEKNDYCDALTRNKRPFTACHSNGAGYGSVEIDRDGYVSANYYISLPKNEKRIYLIFWDENVEEDYVLKFVKSYDPPEHDEPKTTWNTYAC